jgi:hypothetical protein
MRGFLFDFGKAASATCLLRLLTKPPKREPQGLKPNLFCAFMQA